MLIPEICSEYAYLLYVFESTAHLGSHIICTHCYKKKIIISNYSYKRFMMNIHSICCLPLNTIDEFLVSRFVDIKRVQYKDLTLLRIYHC
jgi:hypothetical protein